MSGREDEAARARAPAGGPSGAAAADAKTRAARRSEGLPKEALCSAPWAVTAAFAAAALMPSAGTRRRGTAFLEKHVAPALARWTRTRWRRS